MGAGYFSLFYEFYGIGFKPGRSERILSINQEGTLYVAEILVHLPGRLSVGPFYRYFPTRTRPDGGLRDELIEIVIPVPQLDLAVGYLSSGLPGSLR